MQARAAGPDAARLGGRRSRIVAVLGFAVLGATVAFGLAWTATGHELGTPLPPLLYEWSPYVIATTPLLVIALALAAALAPRLCSPSVSAWRFAGATLVLGLAVRIGLGMGRAGPSALWSVFEVPRPESSNEYLPALGAFDLGTRFFLDTFAEVGTSLSVNAVGHPPGLLVTLHTLGIDGAEAMAALTIGVGALSVPLTYALARRLIGDAGARAATLLYAFAPSAVLHGATSADALFATPATLATLALVCSPPVARTVGAGALAVASFFSWANLGVGALATFVVWRRDGFVAAASLAAACAAGLLAFYGLLHVATGFDPIGAIRAAESVYREGVADHRPYAFWLFGSPAAFLIAAGLPIAWYALRALGARSDVAVALFSVLAIAAVLGFTKSETERIYLFLVPPLCIAAAAALPSERLGAVIGALAAQTLATELLFYTVW